MNRSFLPEIVGSFSTGAAWRGVQSALPGYRHVATSLCGYGGTDDPRDHVAPGLEEQIDAVARMIRFAEFTGCAVMIFHVSTAEAAAATMRGRKKVGYSSVTITAACSASAASAGRGCS